MVKTIKITACLGFIFQLLIASSCSHSYKKEEPKHLSSVVDSLIIEYYTKIYSNLTTNENNKRCNLNLVDSLILDNFFVKYKNFYTENIQLPDSFFIDCSELVNIECFDTREKTFTSRLKEKILPGTVSEFLFQKRILEHIYSFFTSDRIKNIYYPWKLNYSNLYETYLLPIELETGKELKQEYILLINVQGNKLKAIVNVADFMSGFGHAHKSFTRTNRKYFFQCWEELQSDVLYVPPSIETMPDIPKNRIFPCTQFYFDENGYVRIVNL